MREAVGGRDVVATDRLGIPPGGSTDIVAIAVRTVGIRGIPAELNSATLAGEHVEGCASAGTGPAFEFEPDSLNPAEAIQVALRPESGAGARVQGCRTASRSGRWSRTGSERILP